MAKDGNINISRILRLIYLSKGISRIEIAHRLGLDKSTVTLIVARLLQWGIIKETIPSEKAGPRRGRRPVGLIINKDYGCIIGIELLTHSYTLVVMNLKSEVLYRDHGSVDFTGSRLVPEFVRVCRDTTTHLQGMGLKVLGVGVGLTGIVNYHQGIILHSIPLDILESLHFSQAVSDFLDVPVFIENDANCCAWGELAFRRPTHMGNFVFVFIKSWDEDFVLDTYAEIGVGLGFVVNDKLYHGQDYSVGEFRSLHWQAPNKGQFSLSDDELTHLDRDPVLFDRFARELSAHVAMMVNTFNLRHVIVGGSLSDRHHDLCAVLTDQIQANWLYPHAPNCQVSVSALADRVVAYGAAGMFLDRIFEQPEVSTDNDAVTTPGLEILLRVGV